METINSQVATKGLESKRRLFLQKDLFELLQWMDEIEFIHSELAALSIIERQLIKKTAISIKIQGIRRKSTLTMSALCKYDQFIKKSIEYGKQDYDIKRSKDHERQRDLFLDLVKEYRHLKSEINSLLCQFQTS
ncbi:hypothetical protein ACS386_06060 [Flavobacteriaceae bacterium LMO-SS05]